MQNPKNLSTDIFNIDKNIENYLDWPVTEDHFNVIIDIIIKNFFIILNKKNNFEKVLKSDTAFLSQLVQIYHCQVVKKICEKKKI